ncbi:CRISPR-associated helicase Cas3' [Armatimonas sp.]|uniref:CRISPR-associated helicase Cas3' n=1 Tax=Armatimonas sp. TaxID=1872638 RepID=UPI00374D902F
MMLTKEIPDWVAHTPSKVNPHWHAYTDHVQEVTRRATEFAVPFHGEALARYVGLLHDLGKLTPQFQQYLKDCAAGIPRKPGSAPHKQHGARVAFDDLRVVMGEDIAGIVAGLIHGHHGGMKERSAALNDTQQRGASAKLVQALREQAAQIHPEFSAPVPDPAHLFPMPHATDQLTAEMYVRLVFSALVDADALDTEAHNEPGAAQLREGKTSSLESLCEQLRQRQGSDFASAAPSPVNDIRREVYIACQKAAIENPPGVFALTVPTGGGKTRSSLAFALEHAVAYGLRRVVYAIPYTSIVDQTAAVFREIFGEDAGVVLEHHSAIEPRQKSSREDSEEDRTAESEKWRLLAAQNWDAPLVVTTTVQLFESLFSNRPGACRKLHRLAKSVIVLDEVQTLPPTLLEPILSGLRVLVENFGATVVLCTATQPALSVQSEFLHGFAKVTPIVSEEQVKAHFAQLRRVRYQVVEEPWGWEQVAAEMQLGGQSCLCVLNTRRQALELLDLLDPDEDNPNVLHLSTLLCGAHRKKALTEIRHRLKHGPPVLVVSTQVIEAGVDVDFPKVLRAVGPLDRIIQAAGRCNREGLRPRDESQVIVFTPAEDAAPKGIYRMALSQTVQLFQAARARGESVDFDDPSFVTSYFERLYRDLAGEVDAKKIQLDRTNFDYPTVAQKLRLIEQDTISVFVTDYDEKETRAILAQAAAIGKMTRRLWQRAQPLCVSVFANDQVKEFEEPFPGLLLWPGAYHFKRGIDLPRDPSDAVVYRVSSLLI